MTFIKPGIFELYAGPMNSRKTAYLLDRVDQLKYARDKNINNPLIQQQLDFLFIKPNTDTRDFHVKSRSREFTLPCEKINRENPYNIFSFLENNEKGKKYYGLILIDEVQFFGPGIEDVIVRLQKENRNVVAAGLDLDFRGEPFGMMGKLALIANKVRKLKAVCDYDDCNQKATRTQRLINGEPAHYTAPIVSIQGANQSELYQARCLKHHEVPGKP